MQHKFKSINKKIKINYQKKKKKKELQKKNQQLTKVQNIHTLSPTMRATLVFLAVIAFTSILTVRATPAISSNENSVIKHNFLYCFNFTLQKIHKL